jgi:hypothetical protein
MRRGEYDARALSCTQLRLEISKLKSALIGALFYGYKFTVLIALKQTIVNGKN